MKKDHILKSLPPAMEAKWIATKDNGLPDEDGHYWVCVNGEVHQAMLYSGYLTDYKKQWFYRSNGGFLFNKNITHYQKFITPNPPKEEIK